MMDAFIYELSNRLAHSISPEDSLQLFLGAAPTRTELQTIENMRRMGLPDEVINIFVHHIISETERSRLPKAYTEKMASAWARSHVKTTDHALELVKKEFELKQVLRKRDLHELVMMLEEDANDPILDDEQIGMLARKYFDASY